VKPNNTQLASTVCRLLKQRDKKVVFAESCTGGLVAGSLTRTPGISNHLCGALVVYRNVTKERWLQIPANLLVEPGPVSEMVARLMAAAALHKTPEADIAVAVTGHLGPGAPAPLDGVVFVAIAQRGAPDEKPRVTVKRHRFPSPTSRTARQKLAIAAVLTLLAARLGKKD
jgi:PncC family amidohydrolase